MLPRRPRNLLTYEAAQAATESPHPWRNLWIPSIFLAIGLLATDGWMHAHQITRGALLAACFLLASAIVPVIMVFIGYGTVFAGRVKVTLGSLTIAGFKILSILMLTDAAVLWIFEWLLWTGAVSLHMTRGLTMIVTLFVLCIIAVIWGASYPLFNDQDDEFVSSGLVLSGVAWVLHFFLFVLIVVGLASVAQSLQKGRALAAATTVPAGTSASAGSSAPAPASTAPSAVAATDADRQLVRDILAGIVVQEARDWKRMRFAKAPATDALVEKLYVAGARKVYIDLRGAPINKPAIGYVELPPDAKTQATCNAIYQAYLKENRMSPPSPGSFAPTRRFMVIQLKQ